MALPVAAASWPLLVEHRRMEQATALLRRVGAVNDAMLQQGRMTPATRRLLQLADDVMGLSPG
jgi:hypothetical protein